MKIIKTLLAMLLALSMAACSSTPAPATENESSEKEEEVAEETTVQPTTNEKVTMFPKEASIEETTIYDQDGFVIIAKEIDYSGFSPELVLEFQNNTDAEYTFLAGTMGHCANAINGYMIQGGYINEKVAPGMKSIEEVDFSADTMMLLGITEIGEIIMDIEIEDSDYKSVYTGPLSIKTSEYENIDMTPAFATAIQNKSIIDKVGYKIKYSANDVLFDEYDIKMVTEVLVKNEYDEDVLLLEFNNASGKDCYVAVENIGIHGLTVTSGTWDSNYVFDGKSTVMKINLSDIISETEREIFGLQDYGVISFGVTVYDKDHKETAVENKLIEITVGKGGVDTSGDTLYDNNDIVIVSKGLYDDDSEYSDDIHWIMMITNNTDKTITVDEAYDSQVVNGYMADSVFMYSQIVEPGKSAMLDMRLNDYGFEDINISKKEDIKSISTKLKIRDMNYKTIDEPQVSLSFE